MRHILSICILVAVVGGLSGCGPKVPTLEEIKVKVFEEQEKKFWSLSTVSDDYSLLGVYAGQVGHAALAAYPDKPEIAKEWFGRQAECRENAELDLRVKHGIHAGL